MFGGTARGDFTDQQGPRVGIKVLHIEFEYWSCMHAVTHGRAEGMLITLQLECEGEGDVVSLAGRGCGRRDQIELGHNYVKAMMMMSSCALEARTASCNYLCLAQS